MPRSSDTLALLQVRYNRHIALKTTTTTKNPHIIPSTSSVQNSISKISGHFTAFPKPVQMPFFFIILAGLTVPPSLGKVCILVCLYLYKLLTTCCLMKQILKNVCVNLLFRLKAS